MSENDAPGGGTEELDAAEPVTGSRKRTEPIQRDVPTPPPPGGYASIGSGRRGPTIPGPWILAAILLLVAAFGLGFLVGRTTGPDPATDEQVERGGGQDGQRGGRGRRIRSCRQALDLAAQLTELQRQALANQVALTEAVATGDPEQLEALTAAAEQLQQQTTQVEAQLQPVAARCRGRPAAT
jgi:hypothetical protein